MRKLLLILAFLIITSPVLAQNTQCSNRPAGDSTNACANTRFVHGAAAAAGGTSVVDSGAIGDCIANDTAAFQSAINTASAAGGSNVVILPPVPSGGCYRVGAINATLKSGLIIQGSGDASLVKIIGKDASNNWWDLAGTSHVSYRYFKVIDDGTTIPDTLFFWSCAGTNGNCTGGGGVGSGLHFDHVTITAKSNYAFLYAYGFGNIGGGGTAIGNPKAGGGSLIISNSTWTNTNNGPVSANPWSRNALLHIDCLNSASKTSANVTVPANGQASTCWGTSVLNSYFVDVPTAFINTHTFDNNAAIVLYNVNAFTMLGGSVQCLCDSMNVIWSDTQGATWTGTVFDAPDGGSPNINNPVIIGGGINAVIGFYDVFWPVPANAMIAIDQGISASSGGVWNLTIINNNIGTGISVPFIGKTSAGCGSFTATNNWLIAANLQFLAGAGDISTCGSIDANSILQQPGTITLPGGGAVDRSFHVGQQIVAVKVQTFCPVGCTTTIAGGGSGTYTPCTGNRYSIFEAVGGGGAGGSITGPGAANAEASPGGGAGAYSISIATAATIGASQTVNIGAAGAAGAVGNNPGGNGGQTSVGAIITAPGGTGGNFGGLSVGGLGGVAGTGNMLAALGWNGESGKWFHSAGNNPFSGAGANSPFGTGGQPSVGNGSTVAGNAGTGNGSGGSGAGSQGVATTGAGGPGTAGKVIATEYCSIP